MKSFFDNCSERIVAHESIIQATCAFIHVITSRNKTDCLDENSHGVEGLLACLENIFYNSLKKTFNWRKDWKIWHWVAQSCENMPESCVGLVDSLDNLHTGIAKLRSLFLLAMQSKRLHFYLDVLFNSTEAIRRLYHPNAVLFSCQLRRITNAAVELQYLNFCFDMRSDELNFLGVRQIDYALIINPVPSLKFSDPAVLTDGYHLQRGVCKQCQEILFETDPMSAQKKKYLEDVLRDANAKLMKYKEQLSKLSHENQVLRAAFDQLQSNFVLLHEEYSQRLRLLGGPAQEPQLRAASLSLGAPRSLHRGQSHIDFSAREATEDLQVLPGENFSCVEMSPGGPLPRDQVDLCAVEATEDLDVVDLLHKKADGSAETSSLRVEYPCAPNFSELRLLDPQFEVGEQEMSECIEKYRLPNALDLSPSANDSIPDLSQMIVTIKPSNTNYRARFSVPKVASGGVPRRPQLDLLSELQQTDSSFPVTGILSTSVSGGASEETEGACSTSDQVSEIANEVADAEVEFGGDYATATSSSQNTVITSTSTLKPANSCHSLASPPSTNEAEASAKSQVHRSTPELFINQNCSNAMPFSANGVGTCRKHASPLGSPPVYPVNSVQHP
uniref:RUN domain-containing protein n=2 Tax=Mesocestoides corti TaxID=53468 RepID=A0A5K3F4M9_MESCO